MATRSIFSEFQNRRWVGTVRYTVRVWHGDFDGRENKEKPSYIVKQSKFFGAPPVGHRTSTAYDINSQSHLSTDTADAKRAACADELSVVSCNRSGWPFECLSTMHFVHFLWLYLRVYVRNSTWRVWVCANRSNMQRQFRRLVDSLLSHWVANN